MGTLPLPTDSALTRLYSGDFVATDTGIYKMVKRDAKNPACHIYRKFNSEGWDGTEIAIHRFTDAIKVSAECAAEMMQMNGDAYDTAFSALWIAEDEDEDEDEDTEDEDTEDEG
jgi:hypothetical protein